MTLTAQATAAVLDNRKSPSRKVNELDNRGTNYYIAKFWAEAMAQHDDTFAGLAKELAAAEEQVRTALPPSPPCDTLWLRGLVVAT